MLTHTTIERLCKPVVLRRALRMVDAGDLLSDRACRFFDDETVLRARVDSSSSWDAAHRTSVVVDEVTDAVTYYECDCHSAHASDAPCDHVVALLLDFLRDPERYEGYDERDELVTSRKIARLMEQATVVAPAVATSSTEEGSGTVRLEATLGYEAGFDVRFRLVGSKGSYVMRDLPEFVDRVEHGTFASYGQNLAFDHDLHSFTPATREVARFLVAAIQNRRAYAFDRAHTRLGRGASSARELHLSAPELWELLDLYDEEGLLFEDRSAQGTGQQTARHMRIVREDPLPRIRIEAVEGGFEIRRDGTERVVAVGGRALAWNADTLFVCSERVGANAVLLNTMLANPGEQLAVSAKDAPRFCAHVLGRLESCARVEVPPQLEELRPVPCELRFYVDYDAKRSVVICRAQATYGEASLPLFGSRHATSEEAAFDVVRDEQTEAHGREAIRSYFAVRDGIAYAQASGQELGVLVFEGIAALQQVGTVFAYPAFERLRNTARPRVHVGLNVRSHLLEASLRVEGVAQEDLARLLQSYTARKTYSQLSDGSVVRMADAELTAAADVVRELELSAEQLSEVVKVPAYRSFVLDSLVDDDNKDASFLAYVDGVRHVRMDEFEPPATLAQVLRPYQLEGYRWLCGLAAMGLGGILADEMGLGKSLQLIACLLAHTDDLSNVGPALVVCPSSLVYNWEAEFAKFAPSLAVRVVMGTPQERADLRRHEDVHVLVTSYDLLRRDVDDYEAMRLWCVVLDEAQYIKNPTTQAALAAKRLNAQYRIALTGTPVENRLSELWSIFDFVMPGLLGSYEHFRERFERSIVEDEDEDAARRLREALRPFILRRTKRDVARDLPPKIERLVFTHMGDEQRKLYQAQVIEARNVVSQQDDVRSASFQILALLTRMRQICCDPSLVYEDYASGSCKTDAILTLVERAKDSGEKTLVFSQFTSYLDVLSQELGRRGIEHYTIVGSTPSAQRVQLVDAFNQNDVPVFLISLKAGGTGLNLTGATVVVHADPWWNSAAQNQATDRAHRIGQTREVCVYKVVASHTIEEKIMDLQRSKAELADAVVQGDVSSVSLASLTREDLEDLLG